MNILAIDPGPERSAWLVWNPEGEQIIACGEEPSLAVCEHVREAAFRGTPVAVEAVTCYGGPVGAETYDTCYWIGEIRRICRGATHEALIVPYRDISRNLCKIAGAKEAQISAALKERFSKATLAPVYGMRSKAELVAGEGEGKNGHMRSALALAVYVGDILENARNMSLKMGVK